MADNKPEQPFNLGVFADGQRKGISVAEIVALVLSFVWLALVVVFVVYLQPEEGFQQSSSTVTMVVAVIAVLLPLALIWVAAVMARSSRAVREETQQMRASLEAMKNAYAVQVQAAQITSAGDRVEDKLEKIEAAQKQTEDVIATFTSSRDRDVSSDIKVALTQPELAPEEQPSLALGTPVEELAAPITVADFIKAMNFPEDENDSDGFRALRVALRDRQLSKLVRAAEDLLTLLAHDGIYMDDLRPDRAKPEVWRRFAQGERGRTVAALAGVRDRSCLALTAGRMKSDMIFRDAAHHFLRQFDKTFVEFEKNASDQEISDLAETRTARAFMLLGRVSGTFD
ncbi:MAG: hypothetical protein ACWA47_06720 [Brevirhabdus sp.]